MTTKGFALRRSKNPVYQPISKRVCCISSMVSGLDRESLPVNLRPRSQSSLDVPHQTTRVAYGSFTYQCQKGLNSERKGGAIPVLHALLEGPLITCPRGDGSLSMQERLPTVHSLLYLCLRTVISEGGGFSRCAWLTVAGRP